MKKLLAVCFLSIPLLAQATFGKKLYVTVFGGAIASTLLKKPFVKTEVYWYYPNTGKLESSTEGTVNPSYKNECNLYFGGGFAYPIHERLLLSLEISSLYRLDDNNSYYGYHVLDDIRGSIGVSYQLNFRKNSDYTFSNYSLKFLKATNGK